MLGIQGRDIQLCNIQARASSGAEYCHKMQIARSGSGKVLNYKNYLWIHVFAGKHLV